MGWTGFCSSAWEAGVVLAGLSAGAMCCWGRDVPAGIREFRAARYLPAADAEPRYSPDSVTSSEREPPRSRCSQR